MAMFIDDVCVKTVPMLCCLSLQTQKDTEIEIKILDNI